MKNFLFNAVTRLSFWLDAFLSLKNGGARLREAFAVATKYSKVIKQARSGEPTIFFGNFRCHCLNPGSFEVLYREIIMLESYHFDAKTDTPFIIDCGVNIGLALIFFKQLYPKCKILGFEPHDQALRTAEKNVEDNGFKDIELKGAALSDRDGEAILSFSQEEIMASTLTSRLDRRGISPSHATVPTVRLSKFLNQRVDFLKLDIEGMEAAVLRECASQLHFVENIFVEFHWSRNETGNRAGEIFHILEEAGFDLLVTSTDTNRLRAWRPLRSCSAISSFIIYGRRNSERTKPALPRL